MFKNRHLNMAGGGRSPKGCPRLNRTRIISVYLKTIGKQWTEISAYERSVLSSFADELITQVESKS